MEKVVQPTTCGCVLIVESPTGVERHPIVEGELAVGGAAGNDVVVEHPTVSRRHALIRCHDGLMSIEDLGSRNGTYVNGVRVKRAAIEVGDQIHLGLGVLRVVTGSPEAPPAAAGPEPRAATEPSLPAPTLPPPEVAVGWLDLVHRLVAMTHGGEGFDAEGALRTVVVSLGGDGGCLVSWHGAEPPLTVATCGSGEGAVGAGALSAWLASSSASAGGPTFLVLPTVSASPPLAGAWAEVREGSGPSHVALVVSGDFPARDQSGPLLATCTWIIGRGV